MKLDYWLDIIKTQVKQRSLDYILDGVRLANPSNPWYVDNSPSTITFTPTYNDSTITFTNDIYYTNATSATTTTNTYAIYNNTSAVITYIA